MDEELQAIIKNFSQTGTIFFGGKRNTIKTFSYNGEIINIKSFKIPIILNGFIYKYFRKSKAKRSFENASILSEKGIGTPKPIAYKENFKGILLRDSYYVSEHLNHDFTFESIFHDIPSLDKQKMLRGIAQFTFKLHEEGIEFLDHSQANTLVKVDASGNYNFYLVDLNRMKFHTAMSFEKRMRNMHKLTQDEKMIQVISNEYAKLYGQPEEKVYATLLQYTQEFYTYFNKKQALKKRLKFWKK
jgi:hypothetical protein